MDRAVQLCGVFSILLVLTAILSSSYASGHQIAEDLSPPEEGSGSDDEDISDLFSDVIKHDVSIRCYVCTGVSPGSGCNVTLLRQNPQAYMTDCNGHCINLTLGHENIFDCIDKVSAKKSLCFQREGNTMCACGADYCNGPPPPPPPSSSSSPLRPDPLALPDSQQGLDLLAEDEEVNVVLPRTLRQRMKQDNESSSVVEEDEEEEDAYSKGSGVVWCSSVFSIFFKLWWCWCVVLGFVI